MSCQNFQSLQGPKSWVSLCFRNTSSNASLVLLSCSCSCFVLPAVWRTSEVDKSPLAKENMKGGERRVALLSQVGLPATQWRACNMIQRYNEPSPHDADFSVCLEDLSAPTYKVRTRSILYGPASSKRLNKPIQRARGGTKAKPPRHPPLRPATQHNHYLGARSFS